VSTLHLLSAGAARGLAEALAPGFLRRHAASLEAEYGAVGAMRERLASGAPCDVIVLTAAMIEALRADGAVLADTVAPLGTVRTGVAVRAGDALPNIAEPQALAQSLERADAIYFPDPQRATAGIHFTGVLERLGLHERLRSRLRPFPNGAAAMTALAQAPERAPIGCTQVTEILYTRGVTLVGPLPAQFELATVYVVAVTRAAVDPALAREFAAMLSGPATAQMRLDGGFEPQ
jgi:molybdate transport system substrate-binding protein